MSESDLLGYTWVDDHDVEYEVVDLGENPALPPGYVDVMVTWPSGFVTYTCRVAAQVRVRKQLEA